MEPTLNYNVSPHDTTAKAIKNDNLSLPAQDSSNITPTALLFQPTDKFKEIHELIQAQDLFQAIKHPEFNSMCLSGHINDRLAITKLWLELKNIVEAETNLKWLDMHTSELTSTQQGELALCKAYIAILNYKRENEWLALLNQAIDHELTLDMQLWLMRLFFHSNNFYIIHFSSIFHNCLLEESHQSYNDFLNGLKVFLSNQPPWPESQFSLSKLLAFTANTYSKFQATKLSFNQDIQLKLAALSGYTQVFTIINNFEPNLEIKTTLLLLTNSIEGMLQVAAAHPQGGYSTFLHFLVVQAQATGHLYVSQNNTLANRYCNDALEQLQLANIAPQYAHFLKLEILYLRASVYGQLSSQNAKYILLYIKEFNHYAQLAQATLQLNDRIRKKCSTAYYIIGKRLAGLGDLQLAERYLKESLFLLRKFNAQELNIESFNNRKNLLVQVSKTNDRNHSFYI
jgi:hypothetical protein